MDESESSSRELALLQDEIWEGREDADIARRYFRARADRFRRTENLAALFALVAQSAAVVVVFGSHPVAAGILAAISAVITGLGVTQRWPDRRAEHHAAARRANDSHAVWSRLWREIQSEPSARQLASIRKQCDEASRADRETLNAIGESTDEALWVAMEKQVRSALPESATEAEQRRLAPAQEKGTE
jgi:hypothetical protein